MAPAPAVTLSDAAAARNVYADYGVGAAEETYASRDGLERPSPEHAVHAVEQECSGTGQSQAEPHPDTHRTQRRVKADEVCGWRPHAPEGNQSEHHGNP